MIFIARNSKFSSIFIILFVDDFDLVQVFRISYNFIHEMNYKIGRKLKWNNLKYCNGHWAAKLNLDDTWVY